MAHDLALAIYEEAKKQERKEDVTYLKIKLFTFTTSVETSFKLTKTRSYIIIKNRTTKRKYKITNFTLLKPLWRQVINQSIDQFKLIHQISFVESACVLLYTTKAMDKSCMYEKSNSLRDTWDNNLVDFAALVSNPGFCIM